MKISLFKLALLNPALKQMNPCNGAQCTAKPNSLFSVGNTQPCVFVPTGCMLVLLQM